MWKKLMFGIIIGVMLMTVSTGVIYGAQINPASAAANSSSVFAGNCKGDGNGANQEGKGGCDGTGDCINEESTGSGNGSGNGTGICDGTGDCINKDGTGSGSCTGNGNGICDGTGDCIATGEGSNQNCTGNCSGSLIKQNGKQLSSNVNGDGEKNKNAGFCCDASTNSNKYVKQYKETLSFRNAFARFLSFFKFGNNS